MRTSKDTTKAQIITYLVRDIATQPRMIETLALFPSIVCVLGIRYS